MEHALANTSTAAPAAFDGCVTHGKRCARPNVESFNDNDLRSFRHFCGAFLGVLLKSNAAGPAPSSPRDRFDRS